MWGKIKDGREPPTVSAVDNRNVCNREVSAEYRLHFPLFILALVANFSPPIATDQRI
jgi:hypothetical protein